MTLRTVKQLLYAHQMDMGGMPIRQPFPTHRVDQIDPFLLLHHAKIKVPANRAPKHLGVGPHPHRGFSPVTFIFQGGVHHRDSRGNNSVVYAGGAQWMNAGMGIIHSERPPDDIHSIGGWQEIIQLWINTPAKNKMDAPQYFAANENVPTATSADGLVETRVFAGELNQLKGPIPSQTEVTAATVVFKESGTLQLGIPKNHNALLYLLDGALIVDGFGLVEGHHVVQFNNDGDSIRATAKENTRVLFLSGVPLNEKIAKHGPFVMNTETEILQAMRDYQMGKMGVLIEE